MHHISSKPSLALLVLFTMLGCEDPGQADSSSSAETGTEGETNDEPVECPADEMFISEDVEPYFECAAAGPCEAMYQVWDYSLSGGFTASIAGYEAVAECWYEQLAAGTIGRYRIDKDFYGDPGYNTYDVFAGGIVEWRQVDLPEGAVEVRRGPRNLASSNYWTTCRSQWDGGEFLPNCFYEGFAPCMVFASEDQACGDGSGGGTGEDPPIEELPEWPDGGQYSGPCDSIGECAGFESGQAVTCAVETRTCTTGCFDASECDPAPNGDAVPVCADGAIGACHLDCAGGQTCPTGMACAAGLCGWP
ncbi:hypothetical protein [Enhygromyxa salina]|uniref:hypothetical protein n=1 Tax=Enhygromyxa salina TaxID=215803 RepID=UPI000D02B669|nr:hypothetical protein [Enhygromyxa salina]